MIVKSACYAIAGYDPSEATTRKVRELVAEGAKSFGLEIKGPHYLLNWSLLLAALIDRQGGSGDLSGAVRGHAQLLSVRCKWSAEMRYRSARYSAADLDGARASAR